MGKNELVSNVVIIGGGPGGYEAALVAAQLGAKVALVEETGVGGATVLTDCVPSKTLIATSNLLVEVAGSDQLGITTTGKVTADIAAVNRRVLELAAAQSNDITARLERDHIRIISGSAKLLSTDEVHVTKSDNTEERLAADVVLVATGARPREFAGASADGERILNWKQLYELDELPEHLIVVGSGVTGAEFASAYQALGAQVTLVSSREHVLPGQDHDAAQVLEDVFQRRGVNILSKSRMKKVERTEDGVQVALTDGRVVTGSHCLLALGSVPNTTDLGLESAGVELDENGFIKVDRVSRTTARGVYAAGDCTGVFMLASVAAMQGRIAMWHALGDAVSPLNLSEVVSNVFTAPEIATVGVTQEQLEDIEAGADYLMLPISGNARAKMQGESDGFVKIFARRGTGTVIGGVVVASSASELIHPVSLAVSTGLTVDQLAHAFTVYPSNSGSIAEAARRMHKKH